MIRLNNNWMLESSHAGSSKKPYLSGDPEDGIEAMWTGNNILTQPLHKNRTH